MTRPLHLTATSQAVPMSEFVVDDAIDVLVTESLGPCIAIGLRHGEWLALLHQFGPSQGAPEFEVSSEDWRSSFLGSLAAPCGL